ncbi:MAG: 23S rRNA pseudouridine(1911/1915/1917) synthase RluD [Gammaproteobacteria bacterium]|jgi:23S rRNA pseudouridine1911/1915/1917 synthase
MSESVVDKAIIKQVTEQFAGQRLDAALASMFPDYSRSRLQQWIRDGQVLLDGVTVKPKTRLSGDETLELNIHLDNRPDEMKPQDIPLQVVYGDEDIIVLNKPAGLVVHPAAGHADGTLVNALLHFDSGLARIPRAGIVHRLDKDTTGLMVVARNLRAHKHLVEALQQRTVTREYQAVVHGVITAGGTVDAPIGRHIRDRVRMCVRDDGKPAVTHYRVIKRYREHTHVQLKLESGRTHQIRVHMQHIRHPIVGDTVYGGRQRIPPRAEQELIAQLRSFKRQALHAFRLSLVHPQTGKRLTWRAPLPGDMVQLLAVLEQDLERHRG